MKIKSTIKDQKGGAIVEFAIVLPLLILLFAGILEFSICFYNKQVITNASREGARAGINGLLAEPDPEAYIRDIVNDYCFGDNRDDPRLITFDNDISEFSACGSPPCIEINDGAGFTGADLKVSVEYVYNFLLPPFIGLGPSITLYGQTEMDMF